MAKVRLRLVLVLIVVVARYDKNVAPGGLGAGVPGARALVPP
jgi:hypothetical protein